jgi:alkylation response protein AidB-like acyl-CoA dehydrogenase
VSCVTRDVISNQALGLKKHPELAEAYDKLVSRDRDDYWTSGQWMTERGGGSDVANGTETLAVSQPGGKFKLYGYKWFSSAIDADMTLTLARIVGPDGSVTKVPETVDCGQEGGRISRELWGWLWCQWILNRS